MLNFAHKCFLETRSIKLGNKHRGIIAAYIAANGNYEFYGAILKTYHDCEPFRSWHNHPAKAAR